MQNCTLLCEVMIQLVSSNTLKAEKKTQPSKTMLQIDDADVHGSSLMCIHAPKQALREIKVIKTWIMRKENGSMSN